MTEEIVANEPEQPTFMAGQLFDENIEFTQVGQMVEFYRADEQRLNDAMWFWRRHNQAIRGDMENARKRAVYYSAQADGMQTLMERDRQAIQSILESAYGTDTKFDTDWSGWESYLRIAYYSGILSGNAHEAHSLAMHLDGEFRKAEEIWREVSAESRTSEGTYPDPVSMEEAIGKAWKRYGHASLAHPADPRLSEGWERLWRIAKGAGLCEVFDTMAETLGVPKPSVTRSGYIRVRFSGTVDIPVEEWEGTDIDEFLDLDTVAEHIDRYDIDVEGWDEYLDWD